SSFPRGSYYGSNKLITSSGHFIDLYSSTNYGELYINGVPTYPTVMKGNAQVGLAPGDGLVAALDIGSMVDPGYTHSSALNINEWEDISSARFASIVFNRNGAYFAA